MKNVKKRTAAAALACLLLLAVGCGARTQEPSAPAETAAPAAAQATDARETDAPKAAETSKVADASQMTTVEDVVEEGMTPVFADELNEGTYSVAVDCSSSMFRITSCELTVANGAMTALLTMSGDSYGYVYPGTAEAAAAADETAYIASVENAEGKNTFVLPVEALDAGVACAAWSRNKELWYDRTLVFRADSLPLSAFRKLVTAGSLGLADGPYLAEVTLTGGSGKASVQSPAELWVEGGRVFANLAWSSPNYDYMFVDGVRYDAEPIEIATGQTSRFNGIPVAAFDHPLTVIADTTAMSQPHEIAYTLTFDSSTLEHFQW